MASFNKVIFLGNLSRDPELRTTPQGKAICGFSLAANRSWKDEQGAQHEEVTFVDCEAWGKAGEAIAKYCTKGRPLLIEGRLKQDQWEDKATGQKRSRLKVVVDSFQFLGSRGDAPAPSPDTTPPSSAKAPAPALDEDVPF